MAEVTGLTKERMIAMEAATIIDGNVSGDNLILVTRGGTPIDTGNVRGPKGDKGDPGTPGELTQAEADARYLQEYQGDARYLQPATADAAYVNINGDTMTGRLYIPSGGMELSLTADGPFQIGASTGTNVGFDSNEIQARNNGNPNQLSLQPHGGLLTYGTDIASTKDANGTASNPGSGDVGVKLFQVGAVTMRRERADGIMQSMYRGATAGGSAGDIYIRFLNGPAGDVAGNITLQAGPAVTYGTTSDYRLKNEQGPIIDAVDRVSQLRPIRFEWKMYPGPISDGFLAHEVSEVVPEAVTGEKDGVSTVADVENESARSIGEVVPQSLDPAKLVPLLTAAIQELTARVVSLETQLAGA